MESIKLISVNISNKMDSDQIACKQGTGIYVSVAKRLEIASSTVENNKGLLSGAGAYLFNVTLIQIKETNFKNNVLLENNKIGQDVSGGSIYVKNCDNFQFVNGKIESSFAFEYGGGMYLYNVR